MPFPRPKALISPHHPPPQHPSFVRVSEWVSPRTPRFIDFLTLQLTPRKTRAPGARGFVGEPGSARSLRPGKFWKDAGQGLRLHSLIFPPIDTSGRVSSREPAKAGSGGAAVTLSAQRRRRAETANAHGNAPLRHKSRGLETAGIPRLLAFFFSSFSIAFLEEGEGGGQMQDEPSGHFKRRRGAA